MSEHRTNEEQDTDPIEGFLSSLTLTEPAEPEFRSRLEAGLARQAVSSPPVQRRPMHRRLWLSAAGLSAALGLVAIVVLALTGSGSSTANAEAILRRAQLVTASPEAGGISTLAITQTSVSYFLGDERAGQLSRETTVRVWYEAPDQMRTEGESTVHLLAGGTEVSSSASVWDGTSMWNYHPEENSVRILRQDPSRDTFSQAFLLGPSGEELAAYLREAAFCRTVTALGEDEVLGRTADVIELGRPSCGWALPGTDGRRVLWVDQGTGLVLRSEQYSVSGQLAHRTDTVALQLDKPLDAALFRFEPPAGAEVQDDREDQPLGVGYGRRLEQPEPTTLEVVREEATFQVQVPAFIPEGFHLESVEHWWGNETAREMRSHADWVLLRYADADGNWLAVSQGFGGYIAGFASGVPEDATKGEVEVNGTPVVWIDGNPMNQWEPGPMLTLTWPAGRVGDGWEVLPSGETLYGSPLQVGISSNVLPLEQLVQVAESLE